MNDKDQFPPQLTLTAEVGPWGGPTYSYRGARIECLPAGLRCILFMPGHPRNADIFDTLGAITLLIDLWLDPDAG